MNVLVWIVSEDDGFSNRVRAVLQEEGFPSRVVRAVASLGKRPPEAAIPVLLIDLDTVPLDGRTVERLRAGQAESHLLAASKRRFHPELGEAIRDHFFACMGNPPERDELVYLLGAICKDASQG